jgi:hypothetical protein
MVIRSENPAEQRLVDMESGDLVQVTAVPGGEPIMVGGIRLRAGEILQCIENSSEGILVARPDGARLMIDRSLADSVHVQLFWDPIKGWVPDDVRGLAS